MKRIIQKLVLEDLPNKIVLLTGPRQCGKTTLARQLYPNNHDYFNYDSGEDRLALRDKSWNREKKLIIFDELHKMKNWKRWLKGIFDTEGIPPELLVTGSARLDVHRKVGDSLAGRYFQYRLHPLDLHELALETQEDHEKIFQQLWECSGFPEPFFKNSKIYYQRWARTHTDIILRQDLINLYAIRDIQALETLVLLLKSRVSGTISYANLARDLQCDANTIKRWLQLLENLYIIFRVTPYSKNISRALLKEPKYYFYDFNAVDESDGAKLENLVACALLKKLNYIEDTTGIKASLHYLRTKEGIEMDFLVCQNNKPTHLIEVKNSDDNPAPGFKHFSQFINNTVNLQLVKNLPREKTYPDGLAIKSLIPWLASMKIEVSN